MVRAAQLRRIISLNMDSPVHARSVTQLATVAGAPNAERIVATQHDEGCPAVRMRIDLAKLDHGFRHHRGERLAGEKTSGIVRNEIISLRIDDAPHAANQGLCASDVDRAPQPIGALSDMYRAEASLARRQDYELRSEQVCLPHFLRWGNAIFCVSALSAACAEPANSRAE